MPYLERAAKGRPERARIHYNLGLLLQRMSRFGEAETSLLRALSLEPANLEYLYAMADFYVKTGRLGQARAIAQTMVETHPQEKIGHDVLDFIRKRTDKTG